MSEPDTLEHEPSSLSGDREQGALKRPVAKCPIEHGPKYIALDGSRTLAAYDDGGGTA
jgi:hypothetical protein